MAREDANDTRRTGTRRRARFMLWSLVIVLAGSMILPLSGYLYVALAPPAAIAQPEPEANERQVNPRSDYWRAVRRAEQGRTTVPGGEDRLILIQDNGQVWRELRNGPVASIGPWVLAAVLAAIFVFFMVFGQSKVEGARSGRTMVRWTGGERVLHWYTAILFVVLAITGLSLLFGRAALVPVLGYEGFSTWASFSMTVHNYAGPLFLVGVILEVIAWMPYNLFRSYDLEWLRKLGGMTRKDVHAPAGRANAGEKVWFWFIATVGLLVVGGSGLVLDFPNFGQSRETMQIANILHATFGLLWIAISFGHIYLGTIGTEEAFQGMSKGYVSEEWMQQHHNLWYEEVKRGEGRLPEESGSERKHQPASSRGHA